MKRKRVMDSNELEFYKEPSDPPSALSNGGEGILGQPLIYYSSVCWLLIRFLHKMRRILNGTNFFFLFTIFTSSSFVCGRSLEF